MKFNCITILAAVLSFSMVLCSCNSTENITSNDGASPKTNESAEDYSQIDSSDKSGESDDEVHIDSAMGYVCPDLNSVNLYYERTSDHEIKTLDGKLKGSFTYEINESNNEIVFTTKYENLSDKEICADFRPSIAFISDKVDNSNPIVNADFDGHTIEAGSSYSFSTSVEIGEYSEAMINYAFSITIDPATSEYGNNMIVTYVPLGSVFPFAIHLSK